MKSIKDLSVLKKLLIICSLLYTTTYGQRLSSILSDNKSLIFDYELQKNELDSDKLSNSWLNPIRLKYKKTYTTQYGDKPIITGNYSINIDQPIFRSGGIYYGIKYAKVLRKANKAQIKVQKRAMITNAVSILFNIKKTKLQQKKLRYKIKNDRIDIKQKRDSYESGILDSSFLDQSLLQKSQDETSLLQLELNLLQLKQQFAILSNKKPHKLRLPKLKLVSKRHYKKSNLELKRDILRAKQSKLNVELTKAKYLPSISVQAQYINGDINPLFKFPNSTLREEYYNYGFTISMPLDINTFKDIESAKVAKLKSAVEVIDRKNTINKEYDWIRDTLKIINKQINLAHKDEKVYYSLYRLTKNLVEAGEKTKLDSQLMHNSLKIRKIDQQIYRIDKQIQLLKLYSRIPDVF